MLTVNRPSGASALAPLLASLALVLPAGAQEIPEGALDDRGLVSRAEGAHEGYTLFAPLNSTQVFLVDLAGEVVHTWDLPGSPASGLYLQDDGSLFVCTRADDDPRFGGGGIGGWVHRLAPDSSVLWSYRLADEHRHLHHDIEPLPSGNVLAIAWERVSRQEAIALGRAPGHVGERGLWPDVVLELRPLPPDGAEVVWEWRAWDHIVQDVFPGRPHYGAIGDHPGRIDVNGDHRDTPPPTEEELRRQRELEEEMAALGYTGGEEEDEEVDARAQRSGDWLHTNAVAYHPALELIVLSTPHFSELWVIDHSTTTEEAASSEGGRWGRGGDILWRWGNPRMHGAGDADDRRLFYQHDPTWLDTGGEDLRLLVFNNGGGRADGDYTTVEELVLPFDARSGLRMEAGAPCAPAEPAWRYSDRASFFAAFISGAQRLPNGNTLICSGPQGRIFEVTPEGSVVWDYYSPLGGDVTPPDHAGKAPPLALFRATRLDPDHPGVVELFD